MRLCRRRPVVKISSSANFHCMTHDIYIVKRRTNKHKQTDVLLYVNDGCGLNNCYSIKCNKQQEKCCVSRGKICTLGGIDKIGIRPDWITDHGRITDRITEKKVLKKNKSKKIKSFMS